MVEKSLSNVPIKGKNKLTRLETITNWRQGQLKEILGFVSPQLNISNQNENIAEKEIADCRKTFKVLKCL